MEEEPIKANVRWCCEGTVGHASTPSPKCLVAFLPNVHFFPKTSSISSKFISSLDLFPYYNSISSSL